MARFVRLRSAVVNLETIAVIRPLAPDSVTVITTLGYTEHFAGEDAIALLALVLPQAVTPVPSIAEEQLAQAWLQTNTALNEEWED